MKHLLGQVEADHAREGGSQQSREEPGAGADLDAGAGRVRPPRVRASRNGSSRPVACMVSQSAASWSNWSAMNWALSAVQARRPAAMSRAKARKRSAVPGGGSGLPSGLGMVRGKVTFTRPVRHVQHAVRIGPGVEGQPHLRVEREEGERAASSAMRIPHHRCLDRAALASTKPWSPSSADDPGSPDFAGRDPGRAGVQLCPGYS